MREKVKRINGLFFIGLLLCVPNMSDKLYGQIQKASIGAYYFDGWTGAYPYHITTALKDSFSEREPLWGWVTSKPAIMDEQIKSASAAGISFFNFCWYYSRKRNYSEEPLNNALKLYLNSDLSSTLKYSLLVANHEGFEIGPDDWPFLMKYWCDNFKDKRYQTANGKPLLTFFSLQTLIQKFGTIIQVRAALDTLRAWSENGVTIAVCVPPEKQIIELAKGCGFDILTGYNYHWAGFSIGSKEIEIDHLCSGEIEVWNKIVQLSNGLYIPVSTLNWDPRPWANKTNNYHKGPYYVGYSPESVYKSVKSGLSWIVENSHHTVCERILMLYAWNENGEGAWLTPCKNGDNVSEGIKQVLREIDEYDRR
jgi:hypothetical protein